MAIFTVEGGASNLTIEGGASNLTTEGHVTVVTSSGAVSLPTLTASGASEVAQTASGAAVLPSLTAAGASEVVKAASGAAALPTLTAAGAGEIARTSSGAAVLPSLTAAGAAEIAVIASGAVDLPALTASGASERQVTASGAATLPALAADGAASLSGVVSASGAVNLPALTACSDAYIGQEITAGLMDEAPADLLDASGWTTGTGISFSSADCGKAVFDGTQPSQVNFQRTTDRAITNGNELVAYAEIRRTAGQVSSLQVGGGGSDTFGTGAIATSRNAVRRATVTSASRTVGRAVVSSDFEGEIRRLQFHDIQARLDGPLDIYICAGQSNMAGISSVTDADLDIDVVEPRALYVPSKTFNALGAETDGTGTSINANLSSSEGIGSALLCVEPIQHAKADNSAGVSPVTSISTAICNGGVSSGRTAIFIACAAGGTQLLPSGGEWNPSGTDSRYYDLMVAQVNALLALNGSNVVKGMFWCQGESDGATGYAAAFNTMASGLRTSYGDFPIVIMEVGGTVAASAAMVAEQQKLASGSGDASELASCAYVTRRPGAALEADNVHYTAAAQRDRGADAGAAMLTLINATGAVTLPAMTASGAAAAGLNATGAVDLPALSAGGVSERILPATGAIVLPSMTADGAASASGAISASAAATLPAFAASGVSGRSVTSSGAVAFPALSADGSAALVIEASGGVALPAFIASGAATAGESGASAFGTTITGAPYGASITGDPA